MTCGAQLVLLASFPALLVTCRLSDRLFGGLRRLRDRRRIRGVIVGLGTPVDFSNLPVTSSSQKRVGNFFIR